MKETLVDIETYSEVDIKSCGLYRYATDPSFEILLIAYQMINCFCMYSDYTLLTLEEWVECDKKRKGCGENVLKDIKLLMCQN